MKKFYIPYIVFAVIFIFLFLYNQQIPQNNIKKTETNNIIDKQTTHKHISNYYTIKSENNSIFLFDNNNLILNKLDIDYKNLRKFDKDLFDKGIVVSEMSEVYQLIEDFSN